jgi:hypothetical protein
MANTVIQIKYSTATAAPTTLNVGELAYSYASQNLFIGNATSTGVITLPLGNTGVTPGIYGSGSQIGQFTVDNKGRITSATNVALSLSGTLNAYGNTGSGTFSATLNVKSGSAGLSTNFVDVDDTFYITVDNSFIRNNGTQSITGDLSVIGNLTVTGTQTLVNTTSVAVTDSLIKLANNNTVGDVLDIGFYGVSNNGTNLVYHGLARQAAGNFFLFKNLTSEPTGNVLGAGSATAANTATLRANITGGIVSGLASAIAIADGGTNATSFTTGPLIFFNGTSLVSLPNTGTTGTYGNSAYHPIVTVDPYGRVTSISNTAISIDTSAITTGTLSVGRGGTGNTSFTTNGVMISNTTSTTGALSVLTSATEGHVLQISSVGQPTFGYLQGGTF